MGVELINTLIKNQKDAIKHQVLFASLVFVLGCIIIISMIFINNQNSFVHIDNPDIRDTLKVVLGVGGTFISSLSGFPVSQIITRIEKIKTLELINNSREKMNESELKKVEELIWKSVEKIL
jgi:hypothetical protein